MATTTPLIENVMSFIETEFRNITVANSFRSEVAFVSRDLRTAEKIADEKFPALFPLATEILIVNQTNREIEATIKLIVIGVTKFNEFAASAQSAQVQLINLYSDVMEKLYDMHTLNGFNNNTEDIFKITSVLSDEETIFPFAQFRLEADLQVSFVHTDTGRKVQ
jgi:hypothetical protein